MFAWLDRRPALASGVAAAVPLLATAVVLAWRPWVPVLDMAMTELRVRDVGSRHTPLVGLPGRIGAFPDQGSHPGPWSFYLITPIYRLTGSSAWSLQFASIAINTGCLVALAGLGRRRFGRRGAVAFAVLGAIAVRGYGLTVLTHPWNPYFPVLIWMIALVAAWFVLAGDTRLAPAVTAATIVAAQTHVPYLPGALVINAVVVACLARSTWIARRTDRPGPARDLALMFVVAVVGWLPPIVEQLRTGRASGNLAQLVRHFATDQPEPAIGPGPAARLVTHHFDVVRLVGGLVTRDDAFVHQAGQQGRASVAGVAMIAVWLAAAIWAVGRRRRDHIALHAVVASSLLVGWVSISRIFGKVWFYLTLWMTATVALAVIATLWAAWTIARERRWGRHRVSAPGAPVAAAGIGAGVVASVLSLVAVAGHHPPEHEYGDVIRAVLPDIVAAIDHDGADAAYVVFWQESESPGTKGFAVLNELDRRGYRVGVHATWRVPATGHRVHPPGTYDAEIHVVTGVFIDRWPSGDYLEVTRRDIRSDAERARFAELAARVDRRLTEIGRTDLLPSVDENIFRTSLEPGLPRDIVADLDEMLRLGEPIAVFIAPPGSTF